MKGTFNGKKSKLTDLNDHLFAQAAPPTEASQNEPDWRTWEKIELAESEVPGWNALEKYIMESLKIYEGWDDDESAYAPTDKDKYLIWDFISGLICDDGFFDVVCRVNEQKP